MNNFPATLLLILLLVTSSAWSSPKITITNKDGKSLEGELLAVNDESIRFKVSGNDKEYTLPFSKLSEETVAEAKKLADELPTIYPELDLSVVIGKKQKRIGSSYYMKTMEVSTTVKIRNMDNNTPCPPAKGHILYFGQNQAKPDIFSVLMTRKFEFEIKKGDTTEIPLQEFRTEFDSDNKGYNNVGGYKYQSYLLMIMDEDGNIIDHKTNSNKVSKNIEADSEAFHKYLKLSPKTTMNKDLDP